MERGQWEREYRRDGTPVRSEINVTPLVDVCLVLLVIFMVVTPLLTGGAIDIALPETGAPEHMPEAASHLEVAIQNDGRIYLGRQWVPAAELSTTLRDLHDRSPTQHVVVRADRRLRYEDVRGVMEIVSEAGWSGAGIETRRREAPSALPERR